MKQKRTCSACHKHIAKHHRWMTVYHNLKLLGFTLYTYATLQHRDCAHPTEIHQRVKRLKGEVPFPFGAVDGLPAEQNLGGDVYPTYGGIQRSANPLTITEFDPFN